MLKTFLFFIFSISIWAQEFEWVYYNYSNSPIGGWITSIIVDDNNAKWIGTYGDGIAIYQNNTWATFDTTGQFLPSNLVWSIGIDKEHNKWIGCGTNKGGLLKINGNIRTLFNSSNSGLSNNQIHSLTFDTLGNLWIGTLIGGISKFDGSNWTNYHISNSGLPGNEILSITIDPDNNKWIGTWYNGFAKYNDIEWIVYNMDNCPLPHNTVIDIAIDSQNNKWIATEGGGLVQYDGINWFIYNATNSGLMSDDLIFVELDTNENLWVGTTFGGLAFFDRNRWVIFDQNNGLNDASALCVTFDNSDVWVGTWGNGVSVLKNGVNLVTSIDDYGSGSNFKFSLSQNYPNPFNPTTKIKFTIPGSVETFGKTSQVQLKVYDILGNEITTLVNEAKTTGTYEVEFDASNLSSGIYFYQLKSGTYLITKKMLLMK
ncbi:MAG: T9SS type A sorting domain-containing protein [Ignavibacteriae bacterium]|nr:T9SS C-terminal target domain-containing protein [Ignavibacteriota bacterium]NOG97713.1 T9SS type A sorting domain-containing protein [Ignavibacteriota bacterium]